MSEKALLEQLSSVDFSKDNKVNLIIRFSEKTNVSSRKDENIYDAHTGGNTGGSSTPSCTAPRKL